ncbi:hypothetical protein [Floridanema evergladense]|uniref:Ribosomal protein S16 n=1 Tax=Floridaenema evergladense BLCC-F167 TaxID=3153639 RepID=A0ABV4WQF6_9CYAN
MTEISLTADCSTDTRGEKPDIFKFARLVQRGRNNQKKVRKVSV